MLPEVHWVIVRLKYPQSLILAAIRGVTPRCPSEVEGCHPPEAGGRAGVSNLCSEVWPKPRALCKSSGIPSPGHKTGFLSQINVVKKSEILPWLELMKVFFSRAYIFFNEVRSLMLSQKGFNLGQGVFTNAFSFRWLKRFFIFNHPEGYTHKSGGRGNTGTIFGFATLHQLIGKRGEVIIMSHQGITNIYANIT